MAKNTSSGKKLVIVESPTKAKTIRKFLGKDYTVESCMGHVRDLPQSAKDIPEKVKKEPWANLGVNVDDQFEPIYCIPKTKTRIVKTLKDKLKDADELILATDEDREGESISWHLVEVLKPKVPVKRMVFHEITKTAIEKALKGFRNIDQDLVKAQEARRILDRLVGYTISPLLWKKVAYGLSAGRVQSVAVRLISEREHERLRFKKSEYWGLSATCEKEQKNFEARLLSYEKQRVATGKDFDSETGKLLVEKTDQVLHLNEKKVENIVSEIQGQKWKVTDVEEKPVSRKPSPPFITSTLQQESNRKLGFSARETMQLAQKLYEQGFITYMRTDSTFLSEQAIAAARNCIEDLYGKKYLPPTFRDYASKKVKGAQEAHEAIRPAGTEFVKPDETGLTGAQFKLYDLIWKRTVASQMVNAEQKQLSVKFQVKQAVFNSSGMTIEFPGFLKAYVEGSDDPDSSLEDREVRLPQLVVGDLIACKKLEPTQHETKPPARYTEASLVQRMEKDGIGRPSTYAAIISTIQDRGYVKKQANALVPTFTALVVSKLLSQYLPNYVDVNFTSGMENSLDDIAQGQLDYVKYLDSIYFGKTGLKNSVETQEGKIQDETSRSIELDGLKDLSFRIGRYGAYVCRVDKGTGEEVCASLPESQYPGDITSEIANKLIEQKTNGTDALGQDPVTGLPVYVLTGRYGPYVQLGDSDGDKAKPKRMAIPPTIVPDQMKIEEALNLLSLPKTLGNHPDTDKEIKVGLGRFGPYVVHDGDFRSIPKTESLFTLTFARALELLAQPKKVRGGSTPIKELGKHPDTQEEMAVYSGKYGPYIKCGKVNVSLPDDLEPEKVTTELAQELLAPKISKKSDKTDKAAKKKTAAKVAKPAAKEVVTSKANKVDAKSDKKAVKKKGAAVKTVDDKATSAKVIRRKSGANEKALS